MAEPDPQELALYLIGEIVESLPQDTHLYQLDLHKILYLLQDRLDDDNVVAERLPFYWYRHGPVSQAAFDAGNEATRRGIAQTEETEEGTVFIPGPERPSSPSIDTDSEALTTALDELSDIVEDYRFHERRERMLEEEIYIDAPYEFQSVFKFEVVPATRGFSRGSAYPASRLINDFYKAEGTLPLDPAFTEFNTEFSRLVSLADTLLSDEPNQHPLLKAELAELTNTAWLVFCDHLQCETADDYYESQQQQWQREARQSLSTFRQDIDDFEQRLQQAGLFDRDATPATEDDSCTKVIESILNGN